MVNIPDEAVKKGIITIYEDTVDKSKIIRDIEEYNNNMCIYRKQKKRLDEIRLSHLVLNPLLICAFIAAEAGVFFNRPILAILFLFINGVILVAYALSESNSLISTIATSLFLLIDLRFLILLATNILLFLLYEHIKKPLKSHMSYPHFNDIKIRFERGKRLDYHKYD